MIMPKFSIRTFPPNEKELCKVDKNMLDVGCWSLIRTHLSTIKGKGGRIECLLT